MARLARALVAGCLFAFPVASPMAQSDKPLAFEVASIKPRQASDTSDLRFPTFEPGGRFVMVNVPLTALLPQLYPLTFGKLEGQPRWLGTDAFDITAKAPGDATREQMLEMLRSLLRDRFKFAFHYETREEDTFALVRMNPGRLGPGLRQIEVDCTARAAAARAGSPPPPLPIGAEWGSGLPHAEHRRGTDVWRYVDSGSCERALNERTAAGDGPDRTVGTLRSDVEVFRRLARSTRGQRDRRLLHAVREQLGLRLEPQRSPVPVMVIDRLERPTPD